MKQHTAISLFSGAGGMDIGIREAGFAVKAEIEIDKYCCQTLRAAAERDHLATKVIEADIRGVDLDALSGQLGADRVDLLFGGSPCQSFSLAGKQQGLDDERGPLIFEIARFAKHFQPRAILFEQVKGFLTAKGATGKRGEIFERFIAALRNAGYEAKWRVCCAADYGVPQLRERVFVVAVKGANKFRFPEPTCAPLSRNEILFAMPPYATVGDALRGLPEPTRKTVRGMTTFDRADSHVDVTPGRDRERIHHVPEGSYLAAQTHLDASLIKGLKAKDTTKYLRLARNKPANTLRCGEIFFHPTEDRYLTPREYMRLHGYPDNYELKGPIRSRTGSVRNLDQHRQVANSVPPPLARIIGNRIREYLDNEQDI